MGSGRGPGCGGSGGRGARGVGAGAGAGAGASGRRAVRSLPDDVTSRGGRAGGVLGRAAAGRGAGSGAAGRGRAGGGGLGGAGRAASGSGEGARAGSGAGSGATGSATGAGGGGTAFTGCGCSGAGSGCVRSGSVGCSWRTRPSRSARRRTRSACASSIPEECVFTPMPSAKQRSRHSLFVSPSSLASSWTRIFAAKFFLTSPSSYRWARTAQGLVRIAAPYPRADRMTGTNTLSSVPAKGPCERLTTLGHHSARIKRVGAQPRTASRNCTAWHGGSVGRTAKTHQLCLRSAPPAADTGADRALRTIRRRRVLPKPKLRRLRHLQRLDPPPRSPQRLQQSRSRSLRCSRPRLPRPRP
jgi:hypothetical protein